MHIGRRRSEVLRGTLWKQTGLKLPDCIIAATAAYLNMPLVTGDKHFERLKDEIALFRL